MLGLSGAPVFTRVPGIGGKLTIESLECAIAKGGVVSLTLPTETGVLYRIEEIRAIRELTRRYGMKSMARCVCANGWGNKSRADEPWMSSLCDCSVAGFGWMSHGCRTRRRQTWRRP